MSGPAAREPIWQDVECGGYAADLPLWEELAGAAAGPVLDVGCGTGRVSLHLARRGHDMRGLDRGPGFVAVFNERAAGLPARAELGDARDFSLGLQFSLVLAPMQLHQLLLEREHRVEFLAAVASHLRPGGQVAVAIAEDVLGDAGAEDPPVAPVAPDVREVDGWVYSSLPLATEVGEEWIVVRRLRQLVSPAGELSEEEDAVLLRALSAAETELEGEQAGLRPAGRLTIEPTEDHVGSTVVLLRREP